MGSHGAPWVRIGKRGLRPHGSLDLIEIYQIFSWNLEEVHLVPTEVRRTRGLHGPTSTRSARTWSRARALLSDRVRVVPSSATPQMLSESSVARHWESMNYQQRLTEIICFSSDTPDVH